MKKIIVKATAVCLMGSMLLSYAPLAQAATTAGVSSVLSENVITGNDDLYAGVNQVLSQYLVTTAEENLNHAAEVRAAEAALVAAREAELEQQIAEALENSEYSNLGVADVDCGLNIRAAGTTESEIVGKMYHYNVATILDEVDGWYKIQTGEVQGYVKADFVVVGDKEMLKAAGTRYAKVKADVLRVRSEATTESHIIDMVAQDEELIVLDEVDGWVKISVAAGEGWVSTEFVECRTVYTYGETIEAINERLRREEEERRAAQAAAAAAAAAAAQSNAANKTYRNPSGSTGQSVVDFACQFVGNPYVWGGESLTNGADCSGFVMKVYEAFGVSLPHSSSALRYVGYGVSIEEMQPGDIVCYSGHVAIYIGNGQIVHASNQRDGIKISGAFYKTILAVRRIF